MQQAPASNEMIKEFTEKKQQMKQKLQKDEGVKDLEKEIGSLEEQIYPLRGDLYTQNPGMEQNVKSEYLLHFQKGEFNERELNQKDIIDMIHDPSSEQKRQKERKKARKDLLDKAALMVFDETNLDQYGYLTIDKDHHKELFIEFKLEFGPFIAENHNDTFGKELKKIRISKNDQPKYVYVEFMEGDSTVFLKKKMPPADGYVPSVGLYYSSAYTASGPAYEMLEQRYREQKRRN